MHVSGNQPYIRSRILYSLFVGALFSLTPLPLFAATLSTSPSKGEVSVGSTITIRVVLSSADQASNAVSSSFVFDPQYLEITSLSKSGTIMSLWVQEPSYSNAAGSATFEGVILNPGYSGSAGRVISVTLRALKEGKTTVSLRSPQVLANDGSGTSILSGTSGSDITITPKVEKPVEAPTEAAPPPSPSEPPALLCEPQKTGFSRFFDIVLEYGWAVSLILLSLLAIIGLLTMFFIMRMYMRPSDRNLRKEVKDIDIMVHRAFGLLRKNLSNFILDLEDEKENRKLTVLERKFLRELKRDLAASEDAIGKEIHQVKDIIG